MQYVELFCGGGGLAEGLRQAGWECMLAVDNDPHALAIHHENFDHPTLQHDLNQPLPLADDVRHKLRHGGCLAGGSPCQDFALTCTPGKRQKAERAQLTLAFARHVAELQPTWVLFENVKYAAHRTQFLQFVDELRALGYCTEHHVLSVRDLGMCQPRFRLILVAHKERTEVDRVWAGITAECDKKATPKTMRETFEAFGLHPDKNHCYYPVPRALAIQPSVFGLDETGQECLGRLFTVRGRSRPMPATYRPVAKDSTADLTDVFDITTEHLLALQGFPPTFRLVGTKGRKDQMVGNAVPPPLALVLGKAFSSRRGPHASTPSALR